MHKTKFNVYDEDGLFSIVNVQQYKTYVNEDWTLDELFEHFVNEMNDQHMIIWQANKDGGDWIIQVLEQPTGKSCFRSFSKTIEVTNGELYLVNYTDLTMAAQFDDITLPAKENAEWKFNVENGIYTVTVRQMFDPEHYDYDETDSTAFEIIFDKTIKNHNRTACQVLWWEE
jgi:hypothetical protein